MDRRLAKNRIEIILLVTVFYFACDFFVQITGFLKFPSFVGLKSFMPITFGLLFGLYGIIGELLACTFVTILLKNNILYMFCEYIIIIIPGLFAWYFWHIYSETHKIHFRRVINFIRYFVIVLISYFLVAIICNAIISEKHTADIVIWGVSMSILVGIPIDIIYSGLMCLNPILPYLKSNGKKIAIVDDIREFLTKDSSTLASFNEKIEDLAMREKVPMKRLFEIQNCIEEIYLRIIKVYPDAKIDLKSSYDITFSAEFMYIGKKYNPFYIGKDEEQSDIAGLSLIKHRALLASFKYSFGENQIHVVI